MAHYQLVIPVFVVSPSDVTPERRTLERVISELNRSVFSLLGLRLEFVGWEYDSYPGFGVDAQDVINRQIADRYDVLIAILWSRFGTPTARAGSGTEEEFNRALERWRDDPDSVRLMFYVKDGPIAPSEIDPRQLADVQRFKRRLREEGGLIATFSTEEDLERQLRLHLPRLAQEFRR